MSNFLNNIVLAFIGFSSGVVVSGGVFAFIAAIGVVERMAQKTKTVNYIKFYEEVIILSGIVGCTYIFWNYEVHLCALFSVIYCFCLGIFVGTLAVSLAEVIDVIPIFMRRVRLKNGLSALILALALGKTIGSILYFVYESFFSS